MQMRALEGVATKEGEGGDDKLPMNSRGKLSLTNPKAYNYRPQKTSKLRAGGILLVIRFCLRLASCMH